jgi:hypothetical protein
MRLRPESEAWLLFVGTKFPEAKLPLVRKLVRVRIEGLEPPRRFHQILSLTCLPIPSYPRINPLGLEGFEPTT